MFRLDSVAMLPVIRITVLFAACVLFPFGTAQAGYVLHFTTQDFRPFSYEENGAVAGPLREVADAVCAEAGLVCTHELLPWGRAQEQVRKGKADGLYPLGWNEERNKWVLHSRPVVQTEYGFFSHEHSGLSYMNPSDLKDTSVAVYGPSNTSHQLHALWKSVGGFSIDMRPDDEAGFMKLERRRVDWVFSNRDAGTAIVTGMNLFHVRYAGAYKAVQYHFGFGRNSWKKELIERFLTTLDHMYQDGRVAAILSRYGLKPAIDSKPEPVPAEAPN